MKIKLTTRKYGINTFTVFSLLSILYVYSIALEGMFSRSDLKFELPVDIQSTGIYVGIIVAMLLAHISFYFGYKITKLAGLENEHNLTTTTSKKSYTIDRYFSYSSILYLALLVFIFKNEFLSSLTYAGNYSLTYSNSTFSFFKSSIFFLLAVASGLCLSNKKNYFIGFLIAILLFSLGLVFSDKDPMVLSVLAVVSSNTRLYSEKIRLYKYFFFIFTLLFLAFLSKVFSYYRGGSGLFDSISTAYNRFSFSALDGGGPFFSIITVFSDDKDYLYGSSYIDEIINLVPRFLYLGDRPDDISVQFAKDQMVNWSDGMGLGFSPLAESYLNFGFFGSIIQFFIIAILWGWAWKYTGVIFNKIIGFNNLRLIIIYRIVGFYFLLLLFRSPALFFIKSIFYFVVPFVSLYYISYFVSRIGHRR